MNKSQLVEKVARDTGLSRSDARKAVDSVIATVQTSLTKGDDVRLTGFGRFLVVERPARTAQGEPPEGGAGKTVTFTPGTRLRDAIAGHRPEPPELAAVELEDELVADERDEDIRVLPSRRFARTPEPSEEQWTCEIAWKPGYMKSYFRAMAAPPGSKRRRSIAESSPLRWTMMADPEPPTPELVDAVRELAEALIAAGWERTDPVGGPWYALRFRWHGTGEPQRIDELGPKASRTDGDGD